MKTTELRGTRAPEPRSPGTPHIPSDVLDELRQWGNELDARHPDFLRAMHRRLDHVIQGNPARHDH